MLKPRTDSRPIVKTYRTFLLEHYLKEQEHEFQMLNENCIEIHLRNTTVFISGSISCYRVRIDKWNSVSGGAFHYQEFEESTPRSLMFHLVGLTFLPPTFLPMTAPYPYGD